MKAPRRFKYSSHRKMWGFLADNPGVTKYSARRFLKLPDHGKYECYACCACYRVCDNCPLAWPDKKNQCGEYNKKRGWTGWWNKYLHAWSNYVHDKRPDRHGADSLELVSMARRIRDLPLKPEWVERSI